MRPASPCSPSTASRVKIARHAPGARVCAASGEERAPVAAVAQIRLRAGYGARADGAGARPASTMASPSMSAASRPAPPPMKAPSPAAMLFTDLKEAGVKLRMVSAAATRALPCRVPAIGDFGMAIMGAMTSISATTRDGDRAGRFMVGDAGVVQQSCSSRARRRTTRCAGSTSTSGAGGLAETEGEAIVCLPYAHDDGADGPLTIAADLRQHRYAAKSITACRSPSVRGPGGTAVDRGLCHDLCVAGVQRVQALGGALHLERGPGSRGAAPRAPGRNSVSCTFARSLRNRWGIAGLRARYCVPFGRAAG